MKSLIFLSIISLLICGCRNGSSGGGSNPPVKIESVGTFKATQEHKDYPDDFDSPAQNCETKDTVDSRLKNGFTVQNRSYSTDGYHLPTSSQSTSRVSDIQTTEYKRSLNLRGTYRGITIHNFNINFDHMYKEQNGYWDWDSEMTSMDELPPHQVLEHYTSCVYEDYTNNESKYYSGSFKLHSGQVVNANQLVSKSTYSKISCVVYKEEPADQIGQPTEPDEIDKLEPIEHEEINLPNSDLKIDLYAKKNFSLSKSKVKFSPSGILIGIPKDNNQNSPVEDDPNVISRFTYNNVTFEYVDIRTADVPNEYDNCRRANVYSSYVGYSEDGKAVFTSMDEMMKYSEF